MEELLRLVVHEDDVGGTVGDENRVGDVLENQVEPVALVGCLDLGLTDALDLSLQLVGRAAQVGHVAQHGKDRVRRTDPFGDRMREDLEQQVVPLVRVDEVELALALLVRAAHRRAREERAEQQIVDLDRAAPARRIRVAHEQQVLGALVLHDDVVPRVGDHHRVGERVDHLLIPAALLTHSLVTPLGVEMRRDPSDHRAGVHHDRPDVVQDLRWEHRVDDDDAAWGAGESPALALHHAHASAEGSEHFRGVRFRPERRRTAIVRAGHRKRGPFVELNLGR